MTRDANFNPEYVIHSDHEPQRLERQALVYGLDDDLRHLDLRPGDQVLDAGCGPGLLTRAMAQALPQSQVVGMDRVNNPGPQPASSTWSPGRRSRWRKSSSRP